MARLKNFSPFALLFAGGMVPLWMLLPWKAESAEIDASFRHELQRSIDRGVTWLMEQQNSNGWWSTPDHPAVTGLALTALTGDPSGRAQDRQSTTSKGYEFLTSCAKPDGGIYQRDLPSYNTSISIVALLAAPSESFDPVLRRARAFLAGLQVDRSVAGTNDSPFDGGIGYGAIQKDPDVNNTFTALQALSLSRSRFQDVSGAPALNWDAAVHFLQQCQNHPQFNSQPWVSSQTRDRGGFVYYPGRSMAGGETNLATGKVALRSYGSISYAGLLSYVYADLRKDDPRVQAVLDWLKANYTLEENPGMGPQGLYYYYHLMAKGLTAAGVNEIELTSGNRVAWRRELALRLMSLQQREGFWVNASPRWWEKDPVLVTAYAVLTLETLWREG